MSRIGVYNVGMKKQPKKPPLGSVRIAARKSRKELADDAGTSRQQILRIELGMQQPSVDLAMRLAKSLKSTVEELFGNSY